MEENKEQEEGYVGQEKEYEGHAEEYGRSKQQEQKRRGHPGRSQSASSSSDEQRVGCYRRLRFFDHVCWMVRDLVEAVVGQR